VLFYLGEMIQNTFPLQEEFPVVISAKDQSLYYPHLVAIRDKKDKEADTVDEAVAKYLVSIYIKDREEYDYSKSDIYEVNKKFTRLRNTSSSSEYRKFQLFMSKDNPASPIYQFGKNVTRKIKIAYVDFKKENAEDFVTQAKSFLHFKLPTEARVRFTAITTRAKGDDMIETKEDFVVEVGFEFDGASKDENNRKLNFMVNRYKLYKVKK
jgi:type IV secretory pathway component VirB8